MSQFENTLEVKEKSIREIVEGYTRYWFWFLFTIAIAAIGSYIYVRWYTTTLYESRATIIIKDEKSGATSELSAFSDYGGFFSKLGSNKIENELAIFNSQRIISEAVKELDLHITYRSEGTFKGTELYDYKPVTVQYLSLNDSLKNRPVPKLFFEIISDTEYKIENTSKSINGTHVFGERVEFPFGAITVLPGLNNPSRFAYYKGKIISVTHRPIETVALSYQKGIRVANEIKNSNVIILSMRSPVSEKAEDFINELIFQYNKDAINDNSQVAQKTSNFIDSRLDIITRELDSVELGKEEFKSSNRLTNIESEAQLILESASEFNKKQFNVGTQLELSNTMIEYMENASSNDLLPANIGIEGQEISESVKNYNQLILQRNKLLKSSTAKNPVVVNVNNQLEQIRSGILGSLKNTSNGLKVSLRDLNYQESVLNSKLKKVPTAEKLYRGIERQQTIKEQLYLYLLQQREEASISLAVTSPKAKVVDSAYTPKAPVAPNKSLIYLGALLAGALLPFLFIYGKQLMNTKISNRRDVEKVLPNNAIIGEVPKLKKSDTQLVQTNDRSVLAESFRILRTNLQYLFVSKSKKEDEPKNIFVTSTIKGEGKTFVAFNLALTLALTNKKVVLVGADIRNPQLHRYLSDDLKNQKGLTEYIIDSDIKVEELAHKSVRNQNLDIVLSGVIPPNPAELLMQDRVKEFFAELESQYDYVIVDTAPSMLVTDTILINHMADITLYVVRAGYTDKRLLDFPKDAILDGRLDNVALVLNNVDMNNFGYGNKYGYSYTNEKQSFFKRLFG